MIVENEASLPLSSIYTALHKQNTHMGLVYVFSDGSESGIAKIFHWNKGKFIADELKREDYELCTASLPSSGNSRVVLLNTLMKMKNKVINMPYGYLYKKHGFNELGLWMGDGDEGRTCVTAIMDLLESSHIPTVKSETWPVNPSLCIKYLNETRTGESNRNYLVQREISQNSIFICPIELCAVMNSPASVRPMNYTEANIKVDKLLSHMKSNNFHHPPFGLRNLTFNELI